MPELTTVTNRLSLVASGRTEDRAIARGVVAVIDQDPNVRVDDVHVRVQEGVMSLSGIVVGPAARRAALAAAEAAPGVEEVRDEITVR